ncbi:shikimate dehydrogenase [Hypnocyclicus thermotrophus]|uniref:Multifunctional fusion protein n=1 Tax=Hypnocyclicus thermotrophus TaxID=1627895 RepID=A0AA46DZK6_9FUSO|nr:shikimate dehydrogenase [Hypnocyclicus thermotrophus]TDT71769.1 shikimate dehydrogenase [Hypnocyclicus thermotrophus]
MSYGLLGEKLGHSYSKIIHEDFYKIQNLNYLYELIEIKKENLKEIEKKIRSKQLSGVNITIPYKTEFIKYLDIISENAKAIGAVNTIYLKNGKLIGDNTDYYGFKMTLEYNNINCKDKNVYILGSGGSARAILKCILDLGGKVFIVSRNKNKAEEKFKDSFKKINYLDYSQLKDIDKDDNILINCTPIGMYPKVEDSPIEKEIIKNFKAVIDIIYNPETTKLLKYAKEKNIKYVNGLFMLVAQAIKAEEFWGNIEENLFEIIEKIYFKLKLQLYKNNIVLIGMPGSGKTSFGKRISEKLNRKFVDLDEEIEKVKNMSISQIFEKYGEKKFREIESEITQKFSKQKDLIISTGGGIIKNNKNIEALKENGIIIFIDRSLENLINDIDVKHRPLLKNNVEHIKILYNERYSIYNKAADIIVKNNTNFNNVLEKILNNIVI